MYSPQGSDTYSSSEHISIWIVEFAIRAEQPGSGLLVGRDMEPENPRRITNRQQTDENFKDALTIPRYVLSGKNPLTLM